MPDRGRESDAEARAALEALRDEEVDAVVGSRHVLLVRLSEAERKLTESSLQAAQLMQLAEVTEQFIGMCDLEMVPFYINEPGLRLIGLDSLEQARQASVMDFFYPEDRDYLQSEFFDDVLKNGRAEVEIRFRHFKTGAPIWVTYAVVVLTDEHGKAVGFGTVSKDITERRRADRVRARLAAIVESSEDAILSKTLSGTVTSWNRGAEELYGYTADEMVGESIMRIAPPDKHDEIRDILKRLAGGERIEHYETVRQCKDGSLRDVSLSISPIKDPQGNIVGASAIARDITHRKKVDHQLRESELRLKLLTDSLPVLISYVDRNSCYQFNNAAYEEWFGLSREDIAGKPVRDVVGASAFERIQPHLKRALNGELTDYETMVPHKGGGDRYVHAVYVPDTTTGGEVRGLYALVTDITDSKRSEIALRESESRKNSVIESAIDCLITMDHEGRIVDFNPAAERTFGYSRRAVIGRTVAETIIPPRLRNEHWSGLERYKTTGEAVVIGERVELPAQRADGAEFPAELSITVAHTEEGVPFFTAFLRDITDRIRRDETNRTILKELSHRVKNTLAVVQSIARQTMARADDLPSFTERFQDRLRSISSAHSLLTRTNWEGVSLSELLKSELQVYAGSPDQYETSGQDCLIVAQAALTLHMIVHELATNAAKYGALSGPAGRIGVSWSIVKRDTPVLVIEWDEHTDHEVVQPADTGYGTELISQLIEYELDGQVQREFRPSGLLCRIEVPMERITP